MAGIDVPLVEFALIAKPPKIRDIAYMGEEQFFLAAQYLCLDKATLIQDENLLQSLTNFQVLMKVLEQSQDKEKKSAIIMLLKILFPDYSSTITKNSILLLPMQQERDTVVIDDSNFNSFQDAIKQILCATSIFQGSNVVYNPSNARAKEIANKLMRGRQKVQQIKHGGKKESALTRYISILTVGIQSMNIDDCLNLNLFQLFDLMERYNAFVEWDVDLRVKLAGGNPDKQVESWMRDLHPKN